MSGRISFQTELTRRRRWRFTIETRNSSEASAHTGRSVCAIRGTAAGSGLGPALGTDHILLADDGSSTVALRRVPGGSALYTEHTSVIRDRIARVQQRFVVS